MSTVSRGGGGAFWRPGTVAPGAAVERDDSSGSKLGGADDDAGGGGGGAAIVFNANEGLSMARQRRALPIFAVREQLLYCIERYQCTVIVGATGCGKTTRACSARSRCLRGAIQCSERCPIHSPSTSLFDFDLSFFCPTELLQYLDEAGWTAGGRQVICTQPRRIAATTVAARVAQEMGVQACARVCDYHWHLIWFC
jgi:ATP-dependent RNA helicase DDX35